MDSKLEISFGGFPTGYCLLIDIFLIGDVEDAFNTTYLMGCWESVQSNPVSCLDIGSFIGDTINLVEVSHINKSCILGLETYLVEKSGSPSYPFLRKWFLVGASIPIFCFFLFVFLFLFFFFNCRFDFSKDLGLEY